MLKKLAILFGAVFALVGVLGFVPGVTTEEGLLLGIFQVSTLHNIIHLASGAAALVAASDSKYASLWFKSFGVVYAIVALVGIVQGDTVLGIIEVNTADNILHAVLAVAILGVGFGVKE